MFYWKTSDPSVKYIHELLGTNKFNIELLNLEELTEYCIQLAGFTRIGDSDRTECLNVTTYELGEEKI